MNRKNTYVLVKWIKNVYYVYEGGAIEMHKSYINIDACLQAAEEKTSFNLKFLSLSFYFKL